MKFASLLTASSLGLSLIGFSGIAQAENVSSVQVLSNRCEDAVLISQVPARSRTMSQGRTATPRPAIPMNNQQLKPNGNVAESKDCTTTTAPATNEQGQNGVNKCTSCSYSNGGFTVNCIFFANPNQ